MRIIKKIFTSNFLLFGNIVENNNKEPIPKIDPKKEVLPQKIEEVSRVAYIPSVHIPAPNAKILKKKLSRVFFLIRVNIPSDVFSKKITIPKYIIFTVSHRDGLIKTDPVCAGSVKINVQSLLVFLCQQELLGDSSYIHEKRQGYQYSGKEHVFSYTH